MASSMEAIQKILRETVAPGISDIKERLVCVEVEIKRLGDKIDNGLARLDAKIDSVRGEIKTEIHHLDEKLTTALDIRERLIVLEVKVASHSVSIQNTNVTILHNMSRRDPRRSCGREEIRRASASRRRSLAVPFSVQEVSGSFFGRGEVPGRSTARMRNPASSFRVTLTRAVPPIVRDLFKV